MGCVSIPFRRLPHQPKLFVRLIDDYSSVKQFYAHPPNMDAVKEVASSLEYPAERRREAAAILREQNSAFGASVAAMSNLEKLERGAVAVVSGQQVGLFGGPAYAVYKALTAIRLAEELSEAGIPAVPIFWMATEDHDLDEVRHVTWFDSGKLLRFELSVDSATGRPVGDVRLGQAIQDNVKKAIGLLSGPASETISGILKHSYQPEETYGSAFGKLFAQLFAEQGLILLDPLDARLHRIAAPLYKKALQDRDELNEKLLRRGKELESAGYDVQVKVTARSTLLFTIRDGVRQPVAASNAHFKSGDASWTREEALRLVDSSPEMFSANALFRPVVQDYLLPTAAYLGGPAEIAYFAQSSVIYEHVLGRMPVILPRAGFTILDAKAEKLLQKYGLCIENLWAGPQELRRKMESVSVPEALAQNFDRDSEVRVYSDLIANLQIGFKQILRPLQHNGLNAVLLPHSQAIGAENFRDLGDRPGEIVSQVSNDYVRFIYQYARSFLQLVDVDPGIDVAIIIGSAHNDLGSFFVGATKVSSDSISWRSNLFDHFV